MDYLLLRKIASLPTSDTGETLHGLWPLLSLITIVEFKSIGRPYRRGNLDRLFAYVHLYLANEHTRPPKRSDLCAALIVPSRTPALDGDVTAMGLEWKDLRGGYWRLTGGLFAVYVVEVDVVAEQENDDLLRLFSHAQEQTPEARRFWAMQVGFEEARMSMHELEGYDEVMRKLLATLSPQQRLAGLAPDEVLLAMPDEALRALSSDYLETLPLATREAIRRRIGR